MLKTPADFVYSWKTKIRLCSLCRNIGLLIENGSFVTTHFPLVVLRFAVCAAAAAAAERYLAVPRAVFFFCTRPPPYPTCLARTGVFIEIFTFPANGTEKNSRNRLLLLLLGFRSPLFDFSSSFDARRATVMLNVHAHYVYTHK